MPQCRVGELFSWCRLIEHGLHDLVLFLSAAMSSSASGAEQHSNSNTSGRIGNIFDDPELVSSIMRMPSLPGHSVALLDALPGEQFVGQLQDAPARASGLQKPGSRDQSYMLEEETVGKLRLLCSFT